MSMLDKMHFVIRGEPARMHFPGVNFGYGDCDPFVVLTIGQYVVARKPACRDWTSRGESGHYPAEWYLFEIEDGDGEHEGMKRVVRTVSMEEPGRQWERTKKRLIAQAKQLGKS